MVTRCIPLVFLLALSAAGSSQTVRKKKEYPGLRVLAMAAAPAGSRVAVTLEDTSVRIIDAATGATLKSLSGHPQPASAAAWSRDGKLLATGDDSARIFVWDTKTWTKIRTLYGEHQRPIADLSFNAAGTLLLSTGADDKGTVWSMATGRLAGKILGNGANLYSMTFAPKESSILAGCLLPSARRYTFSGGFKNTGFLSGHGGQGFLDIAWSPDGTRAASGGKDGSAIVWDMKKLVPLATLKGHQDWVWAVAFSPNGKLLATSSPDRTVKVWTMAGFRKIADLPDQKSVGSPLVFTSDGKYLLTVSVNDFLVVYSVSPAQAPAPPAKR